MDDVEKLVEEERALTASLRETINAVTLKPSEAHAVVIDGERVTGPAADLVIAMHSLVADFADRHDRLSAALTEVARERDALRDALLEARAHIDGEIDVVDGDYGEPRPNAAMRLAQNIDEALGVKQ